MVTDSILASQLGGNVSGTLATTPSQQSIDRFRQAYERASLETTADRTTVSASSLLNPLLGLDTNSSRLAQQADLAAAQEELRPSELMMLSMRSHEFLFQCELVANVANRSSDGVQQLFRQQS